NVAGCKVYFPSEHTAKFVSDFRVAEKVIYRDRHEIDEETDDWSSLNFSTEEQDENCSVENVDTEMITVAELMATNETNRDESLELEEGDDDALEEYEASDMLQEGEDSVRENQGVAGGEQLRYGEKSGLQDAHPANKEARPSEDEQMTKEFYRSQAEETKAQRSDTEAADGEENKSVIGMCGSSVADKDPEDTEEYEPDSDEDVTVASNFAGNENCVDDHMVTCIESASVLDVDTKEVDDYDEATWMTTS
ncbi:hypothetical protein F441_16835, partial [Phytophthora nicotianae CJ01A1]